MVATLDIDLQVTGLIQTSTVRRPHSLIGRGSTLYIVSAGSDSIIKLDGDGGGNPREPSTPLSEVPVWSYHRYTRCVHVNSLTLSSSGHFYVTAFGAVADNGTPDTVPNGFLMDARNRTLIMTGLHEPHSATMCNNTILLCESGRSAVRDFRGGMLDLAGGYVRGLAATSDRLYVGVSEPRNMSISKSTSVLDVVGPISFGAELRIFSWNSHDLRTARELARVSLRSLAREIFDVMLFQT